MYNLKVDAQKKRKSDGVIILLSGGGVKTGGGGIKTGGGGEKMSDGGENGWFMVKKGRWCKNGLWW